MQTPANPCNRHCCLDARDVCLGCKRTLAEILAWHNYSAEQKRALLDDLARR